MSLNTAHADHGVLIHAGESILLFSDNVNMEFSGNSMPEFKGSKNGRMYLTTHRMIFNSKVNSDPLRSFSFPFIALRDVTVEQPLFSANFIKGQVTAQPNGNFEGVVKFKLSFKSGGAIEFGQSMLKAAILASRGMNSNDMPPPYTPPTDPWHSVPPAAYAPMPNGYYGWVPPYSTFPDQPPPNSVYMTTAPPPYPGIIRPPGDNSGGGYPSGPPAYSGDNGAFGYPPMPNGAYGWQGNTAPGNPTAPPGYPGGFAASGASGDTRDAKAAEAAQSAYYDPNKPQTAFVPPPYSSPPTYQQATSKKEN